MTKTLKDRFVALHGRQHGAVAWLARVLGRSQDHVSRVFNGHRSEPSEWVALAEFLEATPREDWPERWRE